jgi:putative proteasome-type protease
MTYCVAALVEEGIVFASDSRTSASFDNIATFSKMNVFEVPGERVIVILSSGNLATTQGVIARLKMRARDRPRRRRSRRDTGGEQALRGGPARRENGCVKS